LAERKSRLAEILAEQLPSVLLVGIFARWPVPVEQVLAVQLDGIGGKRLDSLYYRGIGSPD
jgi:hypothetical protein